MGPIWGGKDPGGLHVGPMNFAIWDALDGKEFDNHSETVGVTSLNILKMGV